MDTGFANIVMLLMGLLSSKFAPYILKIPVKILMPIVCVLCITGGYASNNSFFDAAMVIVIGLGGYILMSFGFPVAPVVLGLILGPIIEPQYADGAYRLGTEPLGICFDAAQCRITGLSICFGLDYE